MVRASAGGDDGPMENVLLLAAFVALPLAGAIAAGVKAASPEATTARRVELSILAGLLSLLVLFVCLVAYWCWSFSQSFTF